MKGSPGSPEHGYIVTDCPECNASYGHTAACIISQALAAVEKHRGATKTEYIPAIDVPDQHFLDALKIKW